MSGDLARKLALLAALVLTLGSVALVGCGGDDEDAAEEPPAATTEEGTTTEEATTTEEETTTADGGGAEGDAEAGAQLFADNGCGNCHTLEAAGSTGTTGPNLDELQPSFDAAVEQITNGGGVMPAFGDSLTDQEIRDLAAYVVESTGG